MGKLENQTLGCYYKSQLRLKGTNLVQNYFQRVAALISAKVGSTVLTQDF